MQQLNLPAIQTKFKQEHEQTWVWDVVRKKYIVLQPEEWVRQHLIHFFHHELGYPFSLMAVEKQLRSNGKLWRSDIVLYNQKAEPTVLVECKAPEVRLNQETFDQAAKYNTVYKVPLLLISNGLEHFCAKVDLEGGTYQFLRELPDFKTINE